MFYIDYDIDGGIEGMSKIQLLFKLFISTLSLSAFTFGGGYVIITLMRKKFVDEYHWIEEDEMLDLIAIAQSSPGPIAVNGAIVIGYKLAGFLGVMISVIATIIPPFIIISIVSMFYSTFKDNLYFSYILEGMQAGVGAIITSVVFEMTSGVLKEKNMIYIFIMILAFVLNYFFKVNVIWIIFACLCFGVIYSLSRSRGEQQ